MPRGGNNNNGLNGITGTNGSDVLTGTAMDDLIKGRRGDDEIDAGAGNDVVKGGSGNDMITDGAGQDEMWGGSGADTFILVADGDADRIKDWQSQDTIDLSAWGVYDIQQLSFADNPDGSVTVSFGNETLNIEGISGTLTGADFQANDFVLAPPPPPPPVSRTIDFESVDTMGDYAVMLQDGYGDLCWSDWFWGLDETKMDLAGLPSGAENRTGGGDKFGANAGAYDVALHSASQADNFDFESATIGSMFNDGMILTVIGFDDGVETGRETFTVDTTQSQSVLFDDLIFDSVDKVEFQASGGTLNQTYAYVQNQSPNGTEFFYIDDMVVVA